MRLVTEHGVKETKMTSIKHNRTRRRRSRAGLSLVEMLISLAITALLLTATMVAIDTSFQAYAAAAESASTQTSTRLVVHRLLSLVRTSTAHGPLLPDSAVDPPVTLAGNTLTANYLELVDSDGNVIRLEYESADEMLYVTVTPYGGSIATREPLLGGVTNCSFQLVRRLDDEGVWVLERGSIDFTVEPDADTSLALEGDAAEPMRVIASTMPRKLEDN